MHKGNHGTHRTHGKGGGADFLNHKDHRGSTEKIMKKSFNVGADPRVRPRRYSLCLRVLVVFFRNTHTEAQGHKGGKEGGGNLHEDAKARRREGKNTGGHGGPPLQIYFFPSVCSVCSVVPSFPVRLCLRVGILLLCVFAPLREILRNAHAKTRRERTRADTGVRPYKSIFFLPCVRCVRCVPWFLLFPCLCASV